MASTSQSSSPITLIVHMRLKPGSEKRFLELFNPMMEHIDANEPSGNIKYDFVRNNSDENEYTFVEIFKSKEIMEAWFASPKHVEVGTAAAAEGLTDGEPVARFCTRLTGTRN